MKITEIYKKYKIMPQLQEHQLKVAGVAKIICDNLTLTAALSQREMEELTLLR